MSCKPDIKVTKAMYNLYQKGFSLSQVGKAFGVSRQTVYKRFAKRSLPLRPRIKPLPFVLFQGKKYTRRVGGYYGRTDGKRYYLHRVVWESVNGKIPKGYDIHHKDGNQANNIINNLELVSKSEHSSCYPNRQNQYTKR